MFFILQHDSMQCGIACLAMVCKHFGREYSLDALSQICFATNEGVSLLGISEAAKKIGLENVSGRMTIDQLSNDNLPCILHWNQNHFVVLYKVSRNGKKFYVADPGKGLTSYTREEFARHWASINANGEEKGIAMFLEPTPTFYEQKIEDNMDKRNKRSFSFLMGYVKQYRKHFAKIILGLFIGCVLQLVLPFLTQAIVDVGIKEKNIGFVWLILLGQLMLTVSRTAIDFARRWLLLKISMKINISLVNDFFVKLLKLPMSFFDTKLMGDLMQRMSDHSRVNNFLTGQTLSVVFSLLSFVVFGIVLLVYDWLIFAIFILGSALYGAWIALFLRRRKVIDYELFEQQAINNNKTYEFITSMQEIKLQDCERRKREEWEKTQVDLFNVQAKSLRLQQKQEAGSIMINELKNIVITVVSATAVINGNLTLGMMLAVQYIIGQLNSPVEQLMNFIYALQDVKISLERINEIHMAKEEDVGSEERGVRSEECTTQKSLIMPRESCAKDIVLDHVSFKYDPHTLRKTIDDISLTIPRGQVTAIVGASGSGKTTLVKLMLGYYPPSEGQITIGGNDLVGMNKKQWRRQCGVVMQDGVIFSESIAQNIAVDDGLMHGANLVEASRMACVYDTIMSLPLKYSTKIGRDGMGLSQGQRQRILIARAIYKNPDFIFLDEATNSLDAKNEREITKNLEQFYEGRTVVIVAHRLSTVKNADQIIVLENGHIVEKGNHTSLIEKKGTYYELVKSQLELGT